MTPSPTLLQIQNLSLSAGAGKLVVRNASLQLAAGEIVGIVGESGSGKTMLSRAVMRLTPHAISRSAGDILLDGQSLYAMNERQLRAVRGPRVAMVFQEPMTSLTPTLSIGEQLLEGLRMHLPQARDEHMPRIHAMLERVGLRDTQRILSAFPHEFSGGMRQRIMIASAMLLRPALLIADEPTTALDAVVQREVMEMMLELTRENGTAVLLISHDLPMVARYADRMVVMKQGDIVETGPTAQVLAAPAHDYTRQLLRTLPQRRAPRQIDRTAPLMSARDLVLEFGGRQRWFRKGAPARVLKGISLDIFPGEVVAVVGESGSGKTTLGMILSGLLQPTSGSLRYKGQPLLPGSPGFKDYRYNCQMVFQDPYSSLDPRMTVQALVAEALRMAEGLSASDKRERVQQALADVGLGGDFATRYPHELSGGQRQRVAIARVLVRRPALMIADEAVSALDVTVRAQVLDLLAELQQRYGFSCLFISHDLGVVEQIADRVIVVQGGLIAEQGTRDAVFDQPQNPYTRQLLDAIPMLQATPDGGVHLRWRHAEGRANAPADNAACPA
nr:ABC transporter ATP-binding protein [Comamonas koreensis]